MGVVLYEMLTGRVPFDGDTPVSVALKHVGEEPVPPSQLSDEVSKGLEEVILKALSKDPEQRYRTAFEMAVDLKRAMKMPMGGFISKSPDEVQKSAQEERRLRRRAMGWALAAVVAFALCLCAWRGWMIYERLQDARPRALAGADWPGGRAGAAGRSGRGGRRDRGSQRRGDRRHGACGSRPRRAA